MPAIAIVGALFGAALGAGAIEPPLAGAAVGAVSGFVEFTVLAVLIDGTETFLPYSRLGKALERAPFLVAFALKALLYAAIITGVIGGRLGAFVIAAVVGPEVAQPIYARVQSTLPLGVLIPVAFLITSLLLLLHQLRQLIGERTLRNIVFGRYHRARSEERFFLFVDIVGSTTLAERIGPAAVNRFLDRVFQIASDPIDEHGGEIYQYVGDEMVITWTAFDGRHAARPLACFFAIETALGRAGDEFRRDYDLLPRMRAALHAGPVISGEVGGSRRAIVFHGDVMNTASRLESATRDLNRGFLCSGDALSRMDGAAAYALEDLGLQQLRGREAPVRVYSVSKS